MSKERKVTILFAVVFAILAAAFVTAVTLAVLCLVGAKGGGISTPLAIWFGVGATTLLAGGTAAFLYLSLVHRTN